MDTAASDSTQHADSLFEQILAHVPVSPLRRTDAGIVKSLAAFCGGPFVDVLSDMHPTTIDDLSATFRMYGLTIDAM